MLCPSDEIRRFILTEEQPHFRGTRCRCATRDVWNLQLKQGLTVLNPYTTVDAGFITLGYDVLCPSFHGIRVSGLIRLGQELALWECRPCEARPFAGSWCSTSPLFLWFRFVAIFWPLRFWAVPADSLRRVILPDLLLPSSQSSVTTL